ncbi:hypothetical protein Tco_0932889 [Tanacetum coccineum]
MADAGWWQVVTWWFIQVADLCDDGGGAMMMIGGVVEGDGGMGMAAAVVAAGDVEWRLATSGVVDRESSITLRDIISELSLSVAITPDLPITDSLIMGDEHLSTIFEKELDEVIKCSVEDLVPIPRKSMTFSNPLFDSNDDFTSSDDESLSDEDVLEDNVKIYSNPLFEFDDEYISNDVNPLFDEVLEDIESEDSYVSKLDEPDLLDGYHDSEDCPDFEDSRARGFVHRSLDLLSFACLWESDILDLID